MSKEAMECAKGIGKLNPSGIEGRNLFDIESWHFDKAVKIIEKHMARREARLVEALERVKEDCEVCYWGDVDDMRETDLYDCVVKALTHKEASK